MTPHIALRITLTVTTIVLALGCVFLGALAGMDAEGRGGKFILGFLTGALLLLLSNIPIWIVGR